MLALYLLLAIQLYPAATIPTAYKTEPTKHLTITSHANVLPISKIEIDKNPRKKKVISIPVSHQILLPNLHVIPIQHHIYTDLNIVNNKVLINQNAHNNNTHTLIPILIPFLHDLTVIPLHRVDTKIGFNDDDERERYRTPLGGYGAGWGYGGHGAGHGFHHAYG